MKRYLVIVEGRVQGVGFRGFATIHAQRHHLTGSVRNLSNGMVEMFVQGEEAEIDAFLSEVQKGDRFIRVDNLSVKPTAVVEGETKFRYHYY